MDQVEARAKRLKRNADTTIEIDVDESQARVGWDRAEQDARRAGRRAGEGFVRDASGRLRNARGQFISASAGAFDGTEHDAASAGARAGEAFTRDASGRLRDGRGRFVADGHSLGAGASEGVRRGLGGKKHTIDIDVNAARALAGVATVAAAIAGLATVGSAAIAGVGGAAALGIVGAGGFAATMAGLSGVGDAVKALGEGTKSAGGSAGSAAGKHLQMASALDRVRSAQAGLKSARLDAAAAERRALDAVEDAQEGVERAQRDLTSAQQRALSVERELTAAREEAAEALQDLALESEDMGLRQERAMLDVREAKQRLDEVLRDPKATQLQREQAELAYRESLFQQKALAESAEDLAKKKADADRRGVEGSEQVVSAQERIRDAHDGVRDAQVGVADAQERLAEAEFDAAESRRQSAESIAQAQQAVVEAQRGVQQASQSAGSAGAAGMNKIQEAMAGLSPTGQEFARFLRGFIDGPLKELKFAGQEGLLPGLQDGLESLQPMMKDIAPAFKTFSTSVGNALGGMIEVLGGMAPDFLEFASAALDGLAPLKGVFKDLGAELGQVFDRLEASGALDAAMDGIVQIIDAIADHIPELVEVGVQLMALLGPHLADLIDALLPLLLEMAVALGPLLVEAIRAVIPMLEWLTEWIAKNPEDFRMLVKAIIAGAVAFNIIAAVMTAVATGPFAAIAAGIVVMIVQITLLWRKWKPIVQNLWGSIKEAAGNIREWVGRIVDWFQALPGRISRATRNTWAGLTDRFGRARDWIVERAGRLADWFRGLPGRIGRATRGMWDGIKEAFRSALNWIVDRWNGFSLGVDTPFGRVAIDTPNVGRFATGGIASGLAMVGERGRELVRLPTGSSVMSNPDTERLLGQGGGGRMVLELRSGGAALDDLLVEIIRKAVRVRGGDVQVVLGRA